MSQSKSLESLVQQKKAISDKIDKIVTDFMKDFDKLWCYRVYYDTMTCCIIPKYYLTKEEAEANDPSTIPEDRFGSKNVACIDVIKIEKESAETDGVIDLMIRCKPQQNWFI